MNRRNIWADEIVVILESLKPRKPDVPNRKVLALLAALCLSCGNAWAENAAGTIDETQSVLEKWVETKRIISQEDRDWALGKEMLNERVELVQREIDALKTKIKDAEKSITEADKSREELIGENDKYKAASDSLSQIALAMETKTKELLKRLPDPIKERVKPLSQRIPDNPEKTKMSLSERFQNVVGILNEVNKFNREITTTSEVRSLPDGTSSEVTVLYLGIARAYYASANGLTAGFGTISDQGWTWTPDNEHAKQIFDAIAVYKNEKVAAFVQLPIKIQ